MFDRSACARVRVAADAHADFAALTTLAALLRHALNDRLASSIAAATEIWWWGVSFMLTGRKSYGTAASLDEARRRSAPNTRAALGTA
jgi:hypothetical protein